MFDDNCAGSIRLHTTLMHWRRHGIYYMLPNTNVDYLSIAYYILINFTRTTFAETNVD
jgi:ribose 1,5-bisphosphokinase PhnN